MPPDAPARRPAGPLAASRAAGWLAARRADRPAGPRPRLGRAGSVGLAAAVAMPAAMAAAAFTINTGALDLQRGRLRAGADLAAMAATLAPSGQAAAAAASLAGNALGDAQVSATAGMFCADPALPASGRFSAGASTCPTLSEAGPGPNAVQVAARRQAFLPFGSLLSPGAGGAVAAQATALRTDEAGFWISSTLATLDPGAAAGLLGGLLGTSLPLGAGALASLAAARVDVLDVLDALSARLGVAAPSTYADLASTSPSVADVMAAVTVALARPRASGATAAAASAIAGLLPSLSAARLSTGVLVDLNPWRGDAIGAAPPTALRVGVDALRLLSFSIQAAASGAVFSTGALSVALPAGIGTLSVSMGAVSAPARAFVAAAPAGLVLHSAAVHLALTLTLGQPLLGLYQVTLPLYVEAGAGTAQLAAVSCAGDPATSATATVLAQSAPATVWIGQVDQTEVSSFAQAANPRSATVLSVPGLASATAAAHAGIGSGNPVALVFDRADAAAPTMRSVSGVMPTPSLGQTLGGAGLSLTITPLGAGLSLGAAATLRAALLSLLGTVLAPSLDALLQSLLAPLGVQLGSLGVVVGGLRCGMPVIAQ